LDEIRIFKFWHLPEKGFTEALLDSLAVWRVGFSLRSPDLDFREIKHGGESVLVNGAVFKTVSETVRTGSGRFDSYTPPPAGIGDSGLQITVSKPIVVYEM
jgi:hypothetical protein